MTQVSRMTEIHAYMNISGVDGSIQGMRKFHVKCKRCDSSGTMVIGINLTKLSTSTPEHCPLP